MRQRFVTVDPLQDLADPLQWNPYLYANNTPITASDPSGELMCVDSCGSRADRQAKASRRSAIMNPSTGTGMTGGGVKAALPQQQTVKTETGPDYWGYLNSREFQGLAANALVSVGVGLVLGGFCAATAGIGCLLAVGAAAGYSGYLAQAVVTQHYDPREAVQATIGGVAGAGIGLALAPVLSGVKSLASSAITKVLGQTSKAATRAVPASNKIYSARALERMAEEPGPLHNFPGSFDNEIFTHGTRSVSPNYFKHGKPNVSNDSVQYRLPGEINGRSGTFEIFTRPSQSGRTEVIMHRFFRPQ